MMVVPRSKLCGYLSAQSLPNEAPFSLPGWPLRRDVHSKCSNSHWILTLALCLSLAVSTFLGFWGPRDILGPSFSHLCPLHFFRFCFSAEMVPRLCGVSILHSPSSSPFLPTILCCSAWASCCVPPSPTHPPQVHHLLLNCISSMSASLHLPLSLPGFRPLSSSTWTFASSSC